MRGTVSGSTRYELLGPWVAVEQIEAMMLAGGALYRPWTARAPEAFVALVLAIGTGIDDAPFEPGDFVLVEKMSGHPHMAGDLPDMFRGGKRIAGKTTWVDLRASTFGGAPDKVVGLVRYGAALSPCLRDEEAARRMQRGAELHVGEYEERETLDGDVAGHKRAEKNAHERWLLGHELYRDGRRRSRLMKPSADPAAGEGIVAVIRDGADLLRFGVDPAWLAEHLGVEPG